MTIAWAWPADAGTWQQAPGQPGLRGPGEGRARVRGRLPSSGAVVEVALKASDLIELLVALEPEATLWFGVTGPEAPVLAVDGEDYRHLLMPLWGA